MSGERSVTVAHTSPHPARQNRAPRRLQKPLAFLLAGTLALAGCSDKDADAGNFGLVEPTTTTAEPTTTTTETTTTTTTTTTTATETIAPSTTETTLAPESLCPAADRLGVTKFLGAASCEVVMTDAYFTDVVKGAQWTSPRGTMTAKIINDPSAAQFGRQSAYHGMPVQFEEKQEYGVEGYNVACTTDGDTCLAYAPSASNNKGLDTVFEVSGCSRAEQLTVLSNLVLAEAN